jgi:uncharacterized Zn-binding protein involved in type VI secretion
MPAIARKGDDTTTGHGCDAISTVIGPTGEEVNVYVNSIGVECKGNPVAPHTILAGISCVPHSAVINAGSLTVFVGSIAVARIGDSTDAGAIIEGSSNVFAG